MNYSIEILQPKDVPEYLALTQYIDGETNFLGSEPTDPRPSSLQIIASLKAGRQIIFVARNEQGLIAHLGMFWRRGTGSRLKHCMNIGLGVAKDFWKQGIGHALIVAAEAWAKTEGITRIELEVMAHNEAAIALYKKRGFVQEGLKRNSIQVKGEYIDEILMAKLI